MGQIDLLLGFLRQQYFTNTPYSNLNHQTPALHNVTKWQRRQVKHLRLSLSPPLNSIAYSMKVVSG